ncbi:MAG TPA: hypothetical protein VGI33_17625 [Paenibacillus sp.]|jgi:hypothetical protein
MNRNIRFSLLIGVLGFIVTLLSSLVNNLWMTSLTRALIALVIWFVLACVGGWVLGLISSGSSKDTWHDGDSLEPQEERGTRFDLTLPADSEGGNDLLKSTSEVKDRDNNGFEPLSPPKLVSTQDTEQLVKAVRHLTEK